MKRAFLIGLLGLCLAACASAPASTPRYAGTFDWRFETSSFRPDAGGGPYWLSAETVWEDVVAPIQRSGRGPWGCVHLVVEGELSPPGHYGHLGGYDHQLRVTRVIESTLISADGPPSGS